MNHTPEEIIAHNVILTLQQANIDLEETLKYYLFIDIQKSIFWSKEKNQYDSNWSCSKNLIHLPCEHHFLIKEKKIKFENIIKQSIDYCILKFSQSPSL